MSDFIWPATAFLISVTLSLIFKTPIADLIKRIKGISSEGLHAGDDPSVRTCIDSDSADQIATLIKAHREYLERIAQRYEDREDKTIQPLQRQVEELAKRVSESEHRLHTIETNRVIKPMLAAPPLKQSAPK